MILEVLFIIVLMIIAYDIYEVQLNKKKSIIMPFIKKNSNRFYNRYLKKYKIVMSDIDDTNMRDMSSIELSLFIQRITDIIRRETKGIVDRIDTYKTRNGRHIIIYLHNNISMKEVIIILEYLGTDERYIQIFKQKGYFSLFQVRRGKKNISELKSYDVKNGFVEVE